MSLEKKKKSELIDIIKRKDDVEISLRDEIKTLTSKNYNLEKDCKGTQAALEELKTLYEVKLEETRKEIEKRNSIRTYIGIAVISISVLMNVILLFLVG